MPLLRNFSTKHNTWCYRQGFYQYNINKFTNQKRKPISYGKWFTEAEKPINRITRQNKMREFLDQR